MKKPYVSPRAFTEEGYIINQRLLKNLPYGMRQSDYNGCGWVAAYNFLHALGRTKDYDLVRQQMEDGLILGGLLGTHLVQLYLYLRRHGFPLYWAWGQRSAVQKAQCCRAGILFYFNGAALHFVTFIPATREDAEQAPQTELLNETDRSEYTEQQLYRFFNAHMGEVWHIDSLERFLEQESLAMFVVQFTTV